MIGKGHHIYRREADRGGLLRALYLYHLSPWSLVQAIRSVQIYRRWFSKWKYLIRPSVSFHGFSVPDRFSKLASRWSRWRTIKENGTLYLNHVGHSGYIGSWSPLSAVMVKCYCHGIIAFGVTVNSVMVAKPEMDRHPAKADKDGRKTSGDLNGYIESLSLFRHKGQSGDIHVKTELLLDSSKKKHFPLRQSKTFQA